MSQIHLNHGLAHFQAGRFNEAKVEFELAIAHNPADHLAHFHVGLIELKQDHIPLALLSLNRALELNPGHASYITDRAVAKLRADDLAGALADMDQCVQLDNANPYHFSLRAFVREAGGDHHGALEDFRKAVALDPEDSIAFNNMGLVEEKLGHAEAAQKSFSTADRLAGINTLPKEHFVPMKDERPAPVTTYQPQPDPSSAQLLKLMARVVTHRSERAEFLRFITSRLRKNNPST